VQLEPGTYQVGGVHRPSGAVFRREVRLRAGERQTLSGPVQAEVRVRLALKRGDAVRIDGKSYSAGRGELLLPAGRRRVEVLRGGGMVASGWVSLFRDCTLLDEPSLGCR
jgi:phage tail tube protein FII